MVKFLYALLSIILIVLVIVLGVAWRSNYMPPRQKRKDNTKPNSKDESAKGGESDVSTD